MSKTNQTKDNRQARNDSATQSSKSGQRQGTSVITTFQPGLYPAHKRDYQGEADISKSLVIKGGSLFMLLDDLGNADIETNEAHGLYFHDCRFLSKFSMRLGQQLLTPLLNTDAENEIATFELVNSAAILEEAPGVNPSLPAIRPGQKGGKSTRQPEEIPAQSIGISRHIQLANNLIQTLRITNFDSVQLRSELKMYFDSDFLDIFTIRGMKGGKRGNYLPPKVENGTLVLAYHGADNHLRRTTISFDPAPTNIDTTKGEISYSLEINPRHEWQAKVTISLEDKPLAANSASMIKTKPVATNQGNELEASPLPPLISCAMASMQNIQPYHGTMLPLTSNTLTAFAEFSDRPVGIESDNQLFNRVLERCFTDLRMLLTNQKGDIFFAAGVPWFVTLFGRDSLVTALQTIVYNPSIAKGTLELLASYQGTKIDEWQDEQPGKILHELRVGEKANLHEIPFTPYYGTVDATPLFLILMGEYLRWTGNYEFFRKLLPNVKAALDWIDIFGEHTSSGFLAYGDHSAGGLSNQGWKDSGNSIVNSDGSLVSAPVALVEVQGYVYKAKTMLATAFRAIGEADTAERLEHEAAELKDKFNQKFWMPQHNYYAVALQKDERQADSITSNPGQALWTGIVPPERAALVCQRLMQSDMFNGWGVRTLSANEKAYNPFDYQVGSVWPHDNSIIAAGLKRYGFEQEATRIMTGVFTTASLLSNYRLPEVLAGVAQSAESHPVKYPVACRPQAWAAGSIPFMLSSLLGLEPDVANSTLRVVKPSLPTWLPRLLVCNLWVGGKIATLEFTLQNKHTSVRVVECDSSLDVQVEF